MSALILKRARLPPVWRRDDDDFDVLAEGEDQQ
jgi:hypothetical protein